MKDGQASRVHPQAEASVWRVGDLIRDRYEVYDVKAGGSGVVYIVYDHNDRILYALKTLPAQRLVSPHAVNRFFREAEVWVRLGRHQNIVRAVWVDEVEGRPCILLECIVGSSLKGVLSGVPLAKRTVLIYGIQFCRGMVHAQERIPDFAHLDVKPENCLLTQDNTLKVTDFSLSRAFFDADRLLVFDTSTGSPVSEGSGILAGTLPYMSPEHFTGFGQAGIHSDVYSFGVMLYEMLTGRRPFAARGAWQWRKAHLKETPLPPRRLVSSISRELNDLTMACLAKQPGERPEGFRPLLETFEAMLWKEFQEEIPPATGEELESWEYSNMGVSLCHLGHIEEALSCFDRAIAKDPHNVRAWMNKGVAWGTLGNQGEELVCYNEALALEPEYAEAWYNRGLALHRLSHYEEALRCYDRALAIDPSQADVWVNRGSVLGALGRPKEEIFCYDKAIATRPDHARAWVDKAAALIQMGAFEEAVGCCEKALALRPDMAEAWVNKASALGGLQRFDEAIRCCEKALAANPRLCEAWVCKGLALSRLKRLQEAASCYEKALMIDSNRADVWHYQGIVLRNLGQGVKADRCIQRARALDPAIGG